MKHHYILAALISNLALGSTLYAEGGETDSSATQPITTKSVAQKLQGLKMSNEDYHTHKRAIDLLVEEGYGTLAERYYLQEVLGESIKTAKNQEHNENGEAL